MILLLRMKVFLLESLYAFEIHIGECNAMMLINILLVLQKLYFLEDLEVAATLLGDA